MNRGQDPAWIWSRYWLRDDHDDCLRGSLGLTALWRDYLSGFGDGSRLLDLATGSGEAAAFAAAAACKLGRAFDIDGIDSAALPDSLVERLRKTGVRLIGEIDVGALPFEDDRYDGVFSQFGIEYGARPAAFFEAARVLRQNGRGLFVMHHKDSAVTRNCATRLARHRDVIGNAQCFVAAKQLFTSYMLGGSRASLLQAETKLRSEVALLHRRLGKPPSDPNLVPAVRFLDEIAAMPARYQPADALRRVQFVCDDILCWRLRQEAQQRAALGLADLDLIAGWLAGRGLLVAPPEIARDGQGEIAAWVLRFHRPTAACSR